jgi:hypothetical protein
VNVSASNNGIAFSAGTDVNITVTDFVLDASPGSATVPAGQTAVYTVTASPQNGPFRSEIALSCANLPPSTTCAFDPPALTPGAAPARSTLRVTTGASAAAAVVTREPRGWGDWRLRATPPVMVWPAVAVILWLGHRTARRRVAVGLAVSLALACVAGPLAVRGLATVEPAVSASTLASGIAVFPASLDFGTQTVSTATVTKLVSITNIGADTLNFSAITAGGDFVAITSCGTTLAPGASCQVAVRFTPTAVGSRTGALTITDDAAGSPHTVSLVGTGQAAPATGGATPAGSYSVTINGVAGTLTHSTSVTLAVQ